MLYWRLLRKNESTVVNPAINIQNETIDYVYSNSVRSHSLYRGERVVWSLSKTPEGALKWLGERGKGLYDRLAVIDFDGKEGELYDLTDIKSWVSLISKSKNGLIIHNINGESVKSVEAIRSIIPCMNSAISMARECDEVVFIPHTRVNFTVIDDYSTIVRNSPNAKSVLSTLSYDNSTIDALLAQLDAYNISRKAIVQNQLQALKVA